MKDKIKYGVGGVYSNVSNDFQRGIKMGLSRTIKANMHDACVVERICIASRGRNPENPSDRRKGIFTEQKLEPQTEGYSNSITTVQKDNMILESETMEDNTEYRIRRLTAKECWRLMGFSDRDYNAAAQANSSSQLYKQAGNSIVENVLVAIFGQMIPGKENVYREREINSLKKGDKENGTC